MRKRQRKKNLKKLAISFGEVGITAAEACSALVKLGKSLMEAGYSFEQLKIKQKKEVT